MNHRIDETLYLTYSGEIDDIAVGRFMSNLNFGVTNGLKTVHLLLQSGGGIIPAGFALRNYLLGLPVELNVYNAGAVSSIAVVVFLAGKRRYANKLSTFMLHKSYSGLSNLTAQKLALVGKETLANDERIEAVFAEANIQLSAEHREVHRFADLTLGADESLNAGIIHEIRDFTPPAGCQLVHIASSRG